MSNQKRISFGYARNALKEIVIYEKQAEVVKLIFELYSLYRSLAEISKYLEMYRIPSPSNKTVWRRQIINNVLSNTKYIGNADYSRIITEELWNSIQNKRNNSSYSMKYGRSKTAV